MNNDVETDFEAELLDVAEPAADADEQRDRNTHFLLAAWKELLESRRKERAKTTLAGRSSRQQ